MFPYCPVFLGGERYISQDLNQNSAQISTIINAPTHLCEPSNIAGALLTIWLEVRTESLETLLSLTASKC